MLEMKIVVNDVDYEASIDALLPEILRVMQSRTDNKLAASLLGHGNYAAPVIKAALGVLPPQVKDECAAAALTKFAPQIKEYLEQLLAQKGLKLTIGELSVNGG